ncbi:PREDICTED: uncharacterized protein LOC104595734 isoform X2 [Nelumbo nucifera]|uniref:Uncharacterized protein LOC104595734 isoform X2 n=1 Tax=Nelumbo nucifera TaxID=4432 RepID=A0A1U7ZLI5_NELNU|nr:PREDICTED: uncharacterized protein LOC104595734 isoform X2 [Nelumbo nucifera]
MELRKCTRVHCVQAIKRGLVEKSLNVDSNGRPASRFKDIKAIYESEDAKSRCMHSTVHEHEVGQLACAVAKIEEPFLHRVERRLQNVSGICEPNVNCTVNSINNDCDDFSFGEMTLRQLLKKCKTKKRKLSKYKGLIEHDTGSCLHVKQECGDVQHEEEFDLEAPLSRWKQKFSKKSKGKQNCISKHVPSSSKSSITVEGTRQTASASQASIQSTGDSDGTVTVKIEYPEPDVSECYNAVPVSGSCISDRPVPMDFSGDLADEMTERINGHQLDSEESTFLTKESSCCVAKEDSIDNLVHEEPISLPADNSVEETMKLSVSETNSDMLLISHFSELMKEETSSQPHNHATLDSNVKLDEVTERVNGSDLETEKPLLTKEISSCAVNEASIEYLDHGVPTSLPGSSTVGETIRLRISEMTSHESLLCPLLELKKEDTTCQLPSDRSMEANSFSKDPESGRNGICESHSFMEENISYEMDSNVVTQMDDKVTDDSLICTEPYYGDHGCVLKQKNEADRQEGIASDTEHSAISISESLCMSSQDAYPCDSSSMACNSPTTEKICTSLMVESPTSLTIDRLGDCSIGTHPSVATNEHSNVEALENHHAVKLGRSPKRLFSTRQVISPTSQEKLRHAVDSNELLDDVGLPKCREKLCSGKWIKNKASLVGSGLEGAEVTAVPVRIVKKQKNDINGCSASIPKGILKAPHADSVCTSVHACAQDAIQFSQRQMHDIESLAILLTKELNSMKNIVEERLQCEVFSSSYSKYTVDEVCKHEYLQMRTAFESAVKSEETARKWLSMMSRDCSRFCKIMRLAEKKAVASGHGLHKERKKIIFADEAGGRLCHIKVFRDGSTSISSSELQV